MPFILVPGVGGDSVEDDNQGKDYKFITISPSAKRVTVDNGAHKLSHVVA